MCFAGVPDYPPPFARVWIQLILELPEGVTAEIGADEELFSPWQFEGLPLVPQLLDEAWAWAG